MDGSSCSPPQTGSGCGSVNAQYYSPAGTTTYSYGWEVFKVHQNSDSTLCIISVYFPNAYLRMDGSSCSPPQTGSGCGSVNAQYYTTGSDCSGYENFNLVSDGNGQYGIQSVHFPNAYLRMDGSSCSSQTGSGCGSVNAQYYSPAGTTTGGYEAFNLIPDS